MQMNSNGFKRAGLGSNRRIQLWFIVLMLILALFVGRLFYLQVIKHDYYRNAALSTQLKEYSVPAQRGLIKAFENGRAVPLVLNQQFYTLFADPTLVKNPAKSSSQLASITGGDASEYQKLIKTHGTRYVILAKKLTSAQKAKILSLKLPGVGTQAQDYRIYPQGTLAAQLLGFVNSDGQGKYGVEQALNNKLAGTAGKLRAVTDAAGVPLAASRDNLEIAPKNGDDVVLSVDLSMQKQLEDILKRDVQNASSSAGCALIMDPNTGAIKAMGGWPTFDPGQFYKVNDPSVFNNLCASAPLEVGSSMKPLTAAAALDLGVIKPDTTYNDPGHWSLDGHEITNIEEDGGPGTHSIADILNLSINTGATWMLMQMGGQTGTVNKQARDRWYDYMVNHYHFGKPTGIEQGYEAGGYIPKPDQGYALQLAYANTSFGQAMTITMLQMAAAYSSVVNGGTYYQPHLVDRFVGANGATKKVGSTVVGQKVVSASVGPEIRSMLDYAVRDHARQGFAYLKFPDNYEVGGKTGTAQIANPSGGYYENRFNGTYVGFVGGDKPQYVIAVRINEPHLGKYAGSGAAQPIFSDVAHMLINNFNVVPKGGQ